MGVTAAETGGGASNWGLLAIPGSAIGGWWLQTQASSAYYSAQSSHFSTNVGRVAPPPSAPQATTLWAVVVDEDVASGAAPEVVTAKSFDPATLPLNQLGLVLEGDWSLASGHKLRLRVFDHEPSNGELTSGVLLWES